MSSDFGVERYFRGDNPLCLLALAGVCVVFFLVAVALDLCLGGDRPDHGHPWDHDEDDRYYADRVTLVTKGRLPVGPTA